MAVAAALREIAFLTDMQGQGPHRARAYLKGAQSIEALERDLATMVKERTLTQVPGIGDTLARTITELVETGRSAVLERLRQEMPAGAVELGRVLSLPRLKAVQQALGVSSLAELEAAARDGRLADVKGFGPKTVEKLLQDIEAQARRGQKVLINAGQRQGDAVLAFARAQPGVDRAELAGVLRRRQEVIDRIDLVVAAGDPQAAVARVAAVPQAAAEVARGPGGGHWHLAGGLDLHVAVATPDRFGLAWLHATGSPGHVEKLAIVAQARGLALDARGLTRGGAPLPVATEEDLYRHLELPFVPPEMRDDDGEVTAAVDGSLPHPLVVESDVQGMVHCHTTYSDGKHTVEEMARAAEARGMKYITITDHSPTATYAGGLTVDRLRRQWDEIDRVQQKVKIRLLRGSEVDILKDGALDWPDSVLRDMEVVVASIHNRYGLDEREMTKRVVRGLRHPLFKIWGHALGRYVLRRPPIAVKMEEVLEAAAASRVAIEINGNPNRLDMAPNYVRDARRRGLRFTLSVDAHATAELDHLHWAVDMARRGWLRREDVLNTLDADAFARAVRPAA